eukprot:CAMPEP_0119287588 /NCGR_PEP_ID=MMETSP1329-20130426/35846_1 /TAXON_ID=114041 /ORGANISM="Genus nov. species nov., Strain RCC1024" /LENGTH=296 /DNA_ID=CAMNT_0007288349 /DNA_START=85 /DNA_END=971 /DNA_ORIENTATION=+
MRASLLIACCIAAANARLVPRSSRGVRRGTSSDARGSTATRAGARGKADGGGGALSAVAGRSVRGGGGGVRAVTALTHSLIGAAFEAVVLLAVVKAARACPPAVSEALVSFKVLPSATIKGLAAVEWTAWFAVIFGSSALGSLVDSSLRAASRQILMPTTVAGADGWYASLNRPPWEPPGWVFPIMWLLVSKPTQLLAVARVAGLSSLELGDDMVPALAVYALHLALGDAWNKVFFGQQMVFTGALVISIFYGCLLAAAGLFYSIDQTAGLLMLPTCLWVTVASALNWSIWFRSGS